MKNVAADAQSARNWILSFLRIRSLLNYDQQYSFPHQHLFSISKFSVKVAFFEVCHRTLIVTFLLILYSRLLFLLATRHNVCTQKSRARVKVKLNSLFFFLNRQSHAYYQKSQNKQNHTIQKSCYVILLMQNSSWKKDVTTSLNNIILFRDLNYYDIGITLLFLLTLTEGRRLPLFS